MARRSKCKCPKNRKRTKRKRSKKGGENTSEKKRATKTMQKYRRGTLGRRKASRRKAINVGLDTLDPLLKQKILDMSGRGKRKKKSKRKKNRRVTKVTKVTKVTRVSKGG